MKRIIQRFRFLFFYGLLFNFLFLSTAYAVCPLCTIAVGAGVGFSHWLGIDDTITGLWIGGLTISLIIWTIDWLSVKNIRFYGRKLLVIAGYYGLIVVPLYPMHFIGHPLNTFWGIDKLLLGIIIGSVAFYLGHIAYIFAKAYHGGRAYFPFQKVVMPVLPLVVLSIVFYFLVNQIQ
ncbi:MAG: hypothetical protein JW855_04750 [Gammaproteobacteria bacterium]|nr:hypothetical protein [Gammaproteobacteria bacterium]